MGQESALGAKEKGSGRGSDSFFPTGGKEKGLGIKSSDAGPDWLKQFDAVLPGYTLKSQLDILSLLKQVGRGEEKGVVIGKRCCPGQRRQRALEKRERAS